MGHDIWKVTEEEQDRVRFAMSLHREALSPDEFFEHVVAIIANLHAENRFIQNALHPKNLEKE